MKQIETAAGKEEEEEEKYLYEIFINSPALQFYIRSLYIRNGIRRIERGDFEEHNGQKVFVVRGFFEHITKDV